MHSAPSQPSCTLCPRRCPAASRLLGRGYCRAAESPRVARAAPHHWEEPCISGTRGSGTVFFSHCSLGCAFCQNREISHGGHGRDLTAEQLAEVFLNLAGQGVHNLNLVTATHYRTAVQESLRIARERGLALPVVWNTGGYESVEAVSALQGDVDVWLCDLKFFASDLSARLCGAADYFAVASRALERMVELWGPPAFGPDGLLTRGVLVRLLVLPGHRHDAIALLRYLRGALPTGSFLLSVMSQYTPPSPAPAGLPRELCRRLTTFEYRSVLDEAQSLGLAVTYAQQHSSADARYTPPFDLRGV